MRSQPFINYQTLWCLVHTPFFYHERIRNDLHFKTAEQLSQNERNLGPQ